MNSIDEPEEFSFTSLPKVIGPKGHAIIDYALFATTVMTAVDQHHAGAASGVNNATARIGGMIAVALIGLVLTDNGRGVSLAAFHAARLSTGALLDRLTEQEWAREGTHTEVGRYTVEGWLKIYAGHAHGHAEQIRRARAGAP